MCGYAATLAKAVRSRAMKGRLDSPAFSDVINFNVSKFQPVLEYDSTSMIENKIALIFLI